MSLTTIKKAAIFTLFIVLFPIYSLANPPTQDLVLTNASVVNIDNRTITKGTIFLKDGRVADISQLPPGDVDGKVIDLGSRYVIPGLIDMHVHAFGNRGPNAKNDNPGIEKISQRVLHAGVTSFVDLFGDEKTLKNVRQAQRDEQFVGADIYSSLSCLTAPKGHCTEYGIKTRTVNNPEHARQIVRDLVSVKPDVIKIVYQPSDDQPSIDKDTFREIVQQSKQFGIPSIVHIKTWSDVADAIEVGASAVTHTPRKPIPEGLAQKMAKSQLAIIPTLTVHTDFTDFIFSPEVIASPLAKRMTTTSILEGYRHQDTLSKWADREPKWRAQDAIFIENIKQLHNAGVTILAGTDAGNWGTLQGYSLHREMYKLTLAGLNNWEALAAATTHATAFLGVDAGLTIGAKANLVVLNNSPIDDIQNSQNIHLVIHHGKVINPGESIEDTFRK